MDLRIVLLPPGEGGPKGRMRDLQATPTPFSVVTSRHMSVLVSIVIPAYRAQAMLAEAVRSVLAQTLDDWECIVVSDDGVDYGAVLESQSISDSRFRQVSTGRIASGCHAARNRGLVECRGEIVCALDADDVWLPRRLEVLAPQALRHGAGVDSPRVVRATDGSVLYAAFDGYHEPFMLDVSQLLRLTCPLFPLARRDVTFARTAGIEHLEDVVRALRLVPIGVAGMVGLLVESRRGVPVENWTAERCSLD